MTKHTIAVTIALIIVTIPAVSELFGPTAFLAPMTTVFGHSGRRLGEMMESLVFILAGTVVGTGWSTLGLYLSSLLYDENSPASYTVKALFALAIVVFHGYFRSQSPRLFVFLFLCLLTSFSVLLGTSHFVAETIVTQIFYPILTAFGVLLLVGVTVFPEFSSDFLGSTTIDALCDAEAVLHEAVEWFIEPKPDPVPPESEHELDPEGGNEELAEEKPVEKVPTRITRLAALTSAKGKLRSKMASCKQAYDESLYEVTLSVLPPRNLKLVSNTFVEGLVRNVITLISACESKFALVGDESEIHVEDDDEDEEASSSDSSDSDSNDDPDMPTSDSENSDEEHVRAKRKEALKKMKAGHRIPRERVNLAKPKREIAAGDAELLESVLLEVREPIAELQKHVRSAIELVIMSLAYCYDVRRLPSGAVTPRGIMLEEFDLRIDIFETAVKSFDKSSMDALASAASAEREESGQLDIMPRIETFLISSVLLSFRQAAVQTMQMLRHSRKLVERRQQKNGKKRLYLPKKFNWGKWLSSAGEHDEMAVPQHARKEVRTGKGPQQPNTKDGDSDDDDVESEQTLLPMKTDEEACPEKQIPKVPPAHSPQPEHLGKVEKKRKRSSSGSGVIPQLRGNSADIVESVMHSEHIAYALKLAIAVFLVSFPAFYGPWTSWYADARASWAPLQLVLVFEVAIGSSFWIFIVRACGVIFGCVWGYLAYEISFGHLPAMIVFLVVGIIPSAYVQLATPYVKAGMISIVTMCVVATGKKSMPSRNDKHDANTDSNGTTSKCPLGGVPEAHGCVHYRWGRRHRG
jgi:hypothetical protein